MTARQVIDVIHQLAAYEVKFQIWRGLHHLGDCRSARRRWWHMAPPRVR